VLNKLFYAVAIAFACGTLIASFATFTDLTARRVGEQQEQSVRKDSVRTGGYHGRSHAGGGFFGGK
jgi:hypothetical protein